jgi:hypothetical protein
MFSNVLSNFRYFYFRGCVLLSKSRFVRNLYAFFIVFRILSRLGLVRKY